jgi:hypothetical protein
VDLLALPLGTHELRVRAEDVAGNVAEASVRFAVAATVPSLRATVALFLAGGLVDRGAAESLDAKLAAAEAALGRGQPGVARNVLAAFSREVEAQRARHVDGAAADLLLADAAAAAARCAQGP